MTLDLTGYRLTFDDEFNARSISQSAGATTWGDIRSQWRYDANSDIGFGSSSFVDPASGYDPFKVSGGALTITAVPDRTSSGYPGSWESGLITTQGSFSQTYGYFEIRANFSAELGAWDAFWLLPNTQTPDPNNAGRWQELDVVEHYGINPKGVYSTIHTTDAAPNQNWQQNLQVYSEMNNPTGYHTYGMDWEPDKISYYVDGQFVGSQATPSDMHSPMYLLADLATQSNAGGNNAAAAGVPLSSSIDYIRVYSKAPDAKAVALDTVSAPDGHDPGLYGATVAAAPAQPFPDNYFSKAGYLAIRPDVARAGMDPMQHYDQYGWHEGVDPSANFDTQLYLAHNPDVARAGIDPLQHYLTYGMAEGRQTYAAIGPSASFTHGSFDAEYYLLANPDVANAARAAGGDAFAFAYQHFQQYGWHEGRDPNAYFDTNGYLAANPDVRAAGMNPLTHYDTFGWHEGRNPSTTFDTSSYLAAETDVRAVGVDPLTHYLQYGALEGRPTFGSGHF